MKNHKRILSLALAFALALALVPTAALAANVTQVVPFQYKEVRDFHNGFAAVKSENGWGFIDKTGQEVISCQYQEVRDFDQGLAQVKKSHKWGIVDAAGSEITPCKYSDMKEFSEGLAAVMFNLDKWGYIDRTGAAVVSGPLEYSDVGNFHGGLAVVKLNYKWGVIDKTGQEIVPVGTYDYVCDYVEGLAAVRVGPDYNGKWGFIDATGKEVIPCKYLDDPLYHTPPVFSQGLAAVRGDSGVRSNGQTVYKWGFIDKTGTAVVPFQYDYAKPFDQGLAAVNRGCDLLGVGGKWGFINVSGEEVTPCKYMKVYNFHDGLAAVWADNRNVQYGFVDTTGAEVIPCAYGEIGIFDKPKFAGGLARVRVYDTNKYGDSAFIDTAGRTVFKFSLAEDFSECLAAVQKSNGWGYVDVTGTEVIPAQYGEPRKLTEGMLAVDLDRNWGFLSVTDLPSASRHTPDAPATPATYTGQPTNDKLSVDGQSKAPTAYKINGSNYFQLRDVALLLNGTKAQFSVDYDSARKAVIITTGQPYTPNGSEGKAAAGAVEAIVGNNDVYINGEKVDFTVYKINGSNYFKIRDLGRVLGFNVGWTAERGMFIESDKLYDSSN